MSLVRHSFFYVMTNCHTCAFYMGSWLNKIQLIRSIRNTEFNTFAKIFSCVLGGGTHLMDKLYLSLYNRVAVQSVHYF